MYSFKKTLGDLIESKISEYFSQYDQYDISIWNGRVTLTNLVVKPRTLNFGQGTRIRIDGGHISNVNINIPWTKLSSGRVQGVIEDVRLDLRMLSLEQASSYVYPSSEDDWSNIMKMNRLDREEMKLLGLSKASRPWFARLLQGVTSSALFTLFRGFCLDIRRLDVSMSIPVDGQRDVHIRLQIDSFSLSEGLSDRSSDPSAGVPRRGSPDVTKICKTLEVGSIILDVDPSTAHLASFPAHRQSHERDRDRDRSRHPSTAQRFLTVTRVSAPVCVDMSAAMDTVLRFRVAVSVAGLQLGASQSQVETLRDAEEVMLRWVRRHTLRWTIMRPPSGSESFRPRDWWGYIVSCILTERRGSYRRTFRSQIDQAIAQRVLRRRYLLLYRKRMEERLLAAVERSLKGSRGGPGERSGASPQTAAARGVLADVVSSGGEPRGSGASLSEAERQEIAAIERLFSVDSLLQMRSIVYDGLANSGVTVAKIRDVVLASRQRRSFMGWLLRKQSAGPTMMSPDSALSAVADEGAIDAEIARLFGIRSDDSTRDTDADLSPSPSTSQRAAIPDEEREAAREGVEVQLELFVGEVGFCLFDFSRTLRTSSNSGGGAQTQTNTPTQTSLTMRAYGVRIAFHAATEDDSLLRVRVGELSAAGVNDVAVLSCKGATSLSTEEITKSGEDIDSWPASQVALSFQLQRCISLSEGSDGDGQSGSRPKSQTAKVRATSAGLRTSKDTRPRSLGGGHIRSSLGDVASGLDDASSLKYSCKKHYLCQGSLSTVQINWDRPTVSYARGVAFNLRRLTEKIIATPVAFQQLKLMCAKIAMYKSRIETTAAVKVSLDFCCQGFQVTLPIGKWATDSKISPSASFSYGNSSRKLKIFIGPIVVRGGDFLATASQSAKAEPEFVDEDPENSQFLHSEFGISSTEEFPGCSQILKRLQHDDMQPLQIDVSGLQVQICEPDHSRQSVVKQSLPPRTHQLVDSPWTLRAVFTAASLQSQLEYNQPSLRLDIFSTPLKLVFSFKNLADIIDTLKDVHARFAPVSAPVSTSSDPSLSHPPLRVQILAGLCKLHLNVFVREVALAILPERQLPHYHPEDFLNPLFDNILSHGIQARSNRAYCRLTEQRLCLYGIPEETTKRSLNDILRAGLSDLSCTGDSLDAARTRVLSIYKSSRRDSLDVSGRFPRNSSHNPILFFVLRNWSCRVHRFTYDYRAAIAFQEVQIFDHKFLPILTSRGVGTGGGASSVSFSNLSSVNASLERKINDPATPRGGFTQDEVFERNGAGFSPSGSAFELSYLECDRDWGWTQGGCKVWSLYQEVHPHQYSSREGQLTIRCNSLNFFVSPPDLLSIVEEIYPAALITLEHFRTSRAEGSPQPVATNPLGGKVTRLETRRLQKEPIPPTATATSTSDYCVETSPNTAGITVDRVTSLQLEVCSTSVVCAYEDVLFAEILLRDIDVYASNICKSASVGSHDKTERFSVYAVDVADLSLGGSLHPQVLWNDLSHDDVLSSRHGPFAFATGSGHRRPILTILKETSASSVNVRATLHGLKCCVLSRFAKEMIAFWREDFLKPLSDTLNNLRRDAYADYDSDESATEARRRSASAASDGSDGDLQSLPDDFLMQDADDDDDDVDYDRIYDDFHYTPARPYVPALAEHQHLDVGAKAGLDNKKPFGRSVRETEAQQVNKDSVKTILWTVDTESLTLMVPRNSASTELVALTVGSLSANNARVSSSWEAPNRSQAVTKESGPLYFDLETGLWVVAETGQASARARKSSASPFSAGSISSITPSPAKRPPTGREALKASVKGNTFVINPSATAYQNRYSSNFDELSSMSSASFNSNEFCGGEQKASGGENDCDEDDFVDALEYIPTVLSDGESFLEESSFAPSSSFEQPSGPSNQSKHAYEIDQVLRIKIRLLGVMLYSSIGQCSSQSESQSRSVRFEDGQYAQLDDMSARSFPRAASLRKFTANVRNNAPVYVTQQTDQKTSLSSWSEERWKAVSMIPFDLVVVVDRTKEAVRVLLSESETISPLHISASMAEFYLLLSLYFDNFFEVAQWSPEQPNKQAVGGKEDGNVKTSTNESGGSEQTQHSHLDASAWPEYGSEAFCETVRGSAIRWELMIARALIRWHACMDKDYFPEVPSHKHLDVPEISPLTPSTQTHDEKFLPFASISLQRTVLRILGGIDATQVSVGCGGIECADTRAPQRSANLMALRVMPDDVQQQEGDEKSSLFVTTVQAYADMDFGLRETHASVREPLDQPLKFTCYNCGNNWILVNVGVDHPDIHLRNLELVNLITDYFSLYFRRPEYGHVGLECSSHLKMVWPYGGVDTRVFVTRPHAALLENPLNERSQTLLVESGEGVYYRYMFDRLKSVKTECFLYNMSVVISKTYLPPSLARGIRGTSGSARGVRTIIEHLSISFTNIFDAVENHADIQLSVSPIRAGETTKTGGIDVSDAVAERKFAWGGDRSGWQATESMEAISAHLNPMYSPPHLPRSYVNFDASSLQLQPCPVWEPKAVFPLQEVSLHFPPFFCAVVSSIEDMTFVVAQLKKFLSGEESPPIEPARANARTMPANSQATPTARSSHLSDQSIPAPSLFVIVHVSTLRLMLVDSVLGLHAPLMQAFISDFDVTYGRTGDPKEDAQHLPLSVMKSALKLTKRSSQATFDHGRRPSRTGRRRSDSSKDLFEALGGHRKSSRFHLDRVPRIDYKRGSSEPHAILQSLGIPLLAKVGTEVTVSSKACAWVEYFNDMLKCWEPLLDPVVLYGLVEQSVDRGLGITLQCVSYLHLNVTDTLIRVLHTTSSEIETANKRKSLASRTSPSSRVTADERPIDYADEFDLVEGLSRSRRIHSGASDEALVRRESDLIYSFSQPFDSMMPRSRSRSSQSLMFLPAYHSSDVIAPSPAATHEGSRLSASARDSPSSLSPRDDVFNGPSGSKITFKHVRAMDLSKEARVGFSLLNLTGLPLRYFQEWEDFHGRFRGETLEREGYYTIHYLFSNERGILNFAASETILRNNAVVESPFGVQLERCLDKHQRRRMGSGHQVSIQLCGHVCLWNVRADRMGLTFYDMRPLIGRVALRSYIKDNQNLANATKVAATVSHASGGRVLTISSVFRFRNRTNHTVELITHELHNTNPNLIRDKPFAIESGEIFYVPWTLLQHSLEKTLLQQTGEKARSSLGCAWIRPKESHMQPVAPEESLFEVSAKVAEDSRRGDPSDQILYSTPPISLWDIVAGSSLLTTENYTESPIMQLYCVTAGHTAAAPQQPPPIPPGNDGDGDGSATKSLTIDTEYMFPRLEKSTNFCYILEVQRDSAKSISGDGDGESELNDFSEADMDPDEDAEDEKAMGSQRKKGRRSLVSTAIRLLPGGKKEEKAKDEVSPVRIDPISYTIVIHPPFIIENLLPCEATFELVSVSSQRRLPLWSSQIRAGMTAHIHSVSLEEPVALLVHLGFCSSNEGVLVHKPRPKDAELMSSANAIADKLKTFGGLLDDNIEVEQDASILLSDSEGQRLRLLIENTQGGGGQRHLVLYCPYWVVNVSQYSVRLREENSAVLPAGTVRSIRDNRGSVSQPTPPPSRPNRGRASQNHQPLAESRLQGYRMGTPGPLHGTQIALDSSLKNLLREQVDLNAMVKYAALFNFIEDNVILGGRNVAAQLNDSEWSASFSLRSVEVTQNLQVDDPLQGTLEVGFKIKVAPGRLGKYTKILRFGPRFILMNKLTRPVSMYQTDRLRDSQYLNGETSEVYSKVRFDVNASHLLPFHFPGIHEERRLAIEFDGGSKSWTHTPSFGINQLGTYTLKIQKQVDLASLDYIETRDAPEYEIEFPPLYTIDSRDLGIMFETDWDKSLIVVRSIRRGSYAALFTKVEVGDQLLKVDNRDVSGLHFDDAMHKLKGKLSVGYCKCLFRTAEEKQRQIRDRSIVKGDRGQASRSQLREDSSLAPSEPRDVDFFLVRVHLRVMDSSTVIALSHIDASSKPEYRIENRCASHSVLFRQKGVDNIRWMTLGPGDSMSYVWNDPFRPHILLVKPGRNMICLSGSPDTKPSNLKLIPDQISTTDKNVAEVMMDKIDEVDFGAGVRLIAKLSLEGMTKVLKITPATHYLSEELFYCERMIKKQIEELNSFIMRSSEDCLRRADAGVDDSHSHDPYVTRFQAILNDLQIYQASLSPNHDAVEYFLPEVEIPEVPVTSLVAYAPIESVLGPVSSKPKQFVVEVHEARGLTRTLLSDAEYTFAKVYIRSDNYAPFSSLYSSKKAKTEVSDEFENPSWTDQRFVIDVPQDLTPDNLRKYKLRVQLERKNVFGADSFVGRADIPFSCLESGSVTGWVPLRPKSSNVRSLREFSQVLGSVRLSIQWIRDSNELQAFYESLVNKRKLALQAHLQRLNKNRNSFCEPDLVRDGLTTTHQQDRILHNLYAVPFIGRFLQGRKDLGTGAGRALGMMDALAGSRHDGMRSKFDRARSPGWEDSDDANEDSPSEVKVEESGRRPAAMSLRSASKAKWTMVSDTDLSSPDSSTFRIKHMDSESSEVPDVQPSVGRSKRLSWLAVGEHRALSFIGHENRLLRYKSSLGEPGRANEKARKPPSRLKSLTCSSPLTKKVERLDASIPDNESFVLRKNSLKRAIEECKRSFHQVGSSRWLVKFEPVQALKLSYNKYPLFVRIAYGLHEYKTSVCPPSAQPTWGDPSLFLDPFLESESASNDGDSQESSWHTFNKGDVGVFEVDVNNVFNEFRIELVAEIVLKKVKIAHLHIPVFNLLDRLCGQSHMDHWFPLIPSQDFDPVDKDPRSAERPDVSDRAVGARGEHHLTGLGGPCIRMRVLATPVNASKLSRNVFYCRVQIPSVSLSLVDSTKARELMVLTVNETNLRCSMNSHLTAVTGDLAWIQLDNQLVQQVSPIILCPTFVRRPQPTLRFNLCRDNEESQEFDVFRSVEVVVQEFDIHLEQYMILALFHFIKSAAQRREDFTTSLRHKGRGRSDRKSNARSEVKSGGFGFQVGDGTGVSSPASRVTSFSQANNPNATSSSLKKEQPEDKSDKLYIELFKISPIKMNMSFISTPQLLRDDNGGQRHRDSNSIVPVAVASGITTFLRQLVDVILELTSSISDSPICLNAIEIENMFQTKSEVVNRLQEHYTNAALGQLYKIVGSLDLVGSPVALVSSLGSGVYDFFYEPAVAIIRNPTDVSNIGRGVVRGALSLVGNTAYGMIGTATSVTNNAGKGLAALTMDRDFLQNREILQKQPKNMKATALRPVKDIVNGVHCAVVGLVRVPYNGYKKKGAQGLAMGVLKGTTGLAVKPIVGVLDALTHTGEAFRYAAIMATHRQKKPRNRMRLKSLFGPDGRLFRYSYEVAMGSSFLEIIMDAAKAKRNDIDIAETINKRVHEVRRINIFQRQLREPAADDDRKGSAFDVLDRSRSEASARVQSPLRQISFAAIESSPERARSPLGALLQRRNPKLQKSVSESDINQLDHAETECVIYTSVQPKEVGSYHIIIVSTFRVIVVKYYRLSTRTIPEVLWECPLSKLSLFGWKRSEGGSKIVLELMANDQAEETRSFGSVFSETEGGTVADRESLLRVYNCLCVLRGDFSRLLRGEIVGEQYAPDENRIVHIGCWEYVPPDILMASSMEDRKRTKISGRLKSTLEAYPWSIGTHEFQTAATALNRGLSTSTNQDKPQADSIRYSPNAVGFVLSPRQDDVPAWLMEQLNSALTTQNEVSKVLEKSLAQPEDSGRISRLKALLKSNCISDAEFTECVEKERKFGDELRGPDEGMVDNAGAHRVNKRVKGDNPVQKAKNMFATSKQTLASFGYAFISLAKDGESVERASDSIHSRPNLSPSASLASLSHYYDYNSTLPYSSSKEAAASSTPEPSPGRDRKDPKNSLRLPFISEIGSVVKGRASRVREILSGPSSSSRGADHKADQAHHHHRKLNSDSLREYLKTPSFDNLTSLERTRGKQRAKDRSEETGTEEEAPSEELTTAARRSLEREDSEMRFILEGEEKYGKQTNPDDRANHTTKRRAMISRLGEDSGSEAGSLISIGEPGSGSSSPIRQGIPDSSISEPASAGQSVDSNPVLVRSNGTSSTVSRQTFGQRFQTASRSSSVGENCLTDEPSQTSASHDGHPRESMGAPQLNHPSPELPKGSRGEPGTAPSESRDNRPMSSSSAVSDLTDGDKAQQVASPTSLL